MKHQNPERTLLTSVTISALAALGLLIQDSYGPNPGAGYRKEYQLLVQGPGFESVIGEGERPFIFDSRFREGSSRFEERDFRKQVPLSKPGR